MTEEKDWLREWRDMMCAKMNGIADDEWFPDARIRCETPDGIVTCDECRYNDAINKLPDTCSGCEECVFSWYDSEWHCGDKPGDIGHGMILDNNIYMTIHENCPLRGSDD